MTDPAVGQAVAQQQFYQLLGTLLATDNDQRMHAEEAYNNIPIETKVTFLFASLHDASMDENMRSMSAVLLRRLFASDFQDFYPKLPPEGQAQFKQQVLQTLQVQQSPVVRKKVCDVVAEVARDLIDDDGNNQWPEFLQFLFQYASAGDPNLKEAALRMFTSVPGVFGNMQSQYLDVIKQMLSASLQPDEQYFVRVQAVKALGSFVSMHDKEVTIQKHFADLLPNFMQVVHLSLEQRDDDDALIQVLIELAESTPKYLRSQIQPIFQMCIKVFGDQEADDSTRQLCLEVMVTLAEAAPAMVRRQALPQVAQLTPLVLQTMADLDDDDDWANQDDLAVEDNDSNSVVAESSLDRLCCALGGKTMLSLIMATVPSMLQAQDWRQRHAALMAVSSAGEGCHKQMEALLSEIMGGLLEFLRDPHPRVRHAACNAVGQMSTDFAPIFEKKFHAQVVPGLLMVLDDSANPRVQAHAAAALVNFSEDCPKNILTQYLDAIMGKLEGILNSKFKELVEDGTKLVLEQVVTTIASVADTAEKDFEVYYDRLMPCLKYIIQNAKTDELKMLRGKTIECVSLIGLAVGENKFMRDASEVMDLLLKTADGDLPEDDPQTSYLISAWARICKILGSKFEQYLPLVMGPVMKMAAIKPEVALLDNDDLESIEDDVDWQFVTLGEQQNFGIKTAGLEDKAAACDMLVCYARELKEGFAAYAEDVVKLMVSLFKFYFHDGVRTSAAESLPYLLECATVKGPLYVQGMWAFICPELLKAIDTEPEQEVLIELLHSLAKCIEKLGPGCLTEEAMAEVLRLINKIMEEHFQKAVERLEQRKDEDYDEVVEEQLEDEDSDDVYCLSKVADVIHALMMTYRVNFYPYLDQIVGHFASLLSPDRPSTDHHWGICIFDDIIEFGGPACAKYQHYFLQPIVNSVINEAAEVRQAAAYGCGVIAQFGGDQFAQTCAQSLGKLIQIINEPDSREPEKINATENCISAVTKILQYNNTAIDVEDILRHWITWLPLVEDADEAPHVYGYLAKLLEARHPIAVGASGEGLPRALAAFAASLASGALLPESEAAQRLLAITRDLQTNTELFNACITAMTTEQQRALHDALTPAT
ncbi:karyopherin beta 3 isoform X2 [Arctopsyche grandis]|uniref:karyopherin beta 3 isoform X2 n=1 Tax=Arctopsyche grandis TaxID=121162 RepID=UPI00406D8BF0